MQFALFTSELGEIMFRAPDRQGTAAAHASGIASRMHPILTRPG